MNPPKAFGKTAVAVAGSIFVPQGDAEFFFGSLGIGVGVGLGATVFSPIPGGAPVGAAIGGLVFGNIGANFGRSVDCLKP